MRILSAGTSFYPERPLLNIVGGTIADDLTNECTTITLNSGATYTATSSITTPHLVGSGSAPGQTIGNATQLGTGPSGAISGTDLAGFVTVTTGTTPAAFVGSTAVTLITVAFATAYAAAPKSIQVAAGNATAAVAETGTTGVSFYVEQASITASQFVIKAVSVGTPTLAASSAFILYYSVSA